MATVGGIDATFGPCIAEGPDYTPETPGQRYVTPAEYMKLVRLNAQVGMETVVYDARLWSTNAAVRDVALAFWAPEFENIAAWDLGDEFDPDGAGLADVDRTMGHRPRGRHRSVGDPPVHEHTAVRERTQPSAVRRP